MSDTTDSDGDQVTLNRYGRVQPVANGWTCTVCGRESDDRQALQHCHPSDRLAEERDNAVTAETTSHTHFAWVPQLWPEMRALFERVAATIRDRPDEVSPLQVAADVFADRGMAGGFRSDAFELFAHLVCLQEHWLLPGYPRYTTTGEDGHPSIERFCSAADRFPGTVRSEDIAASTAITGERIYRATVYRTTDEFYRRSGLVPGETPWQWQTVQPIEDREMKPMGLFGEGTAHNVITAEARNWLVSHPDIDWAVAPHRMGAPVTELGAHQEPSLSPQEAEQPPEDPVWMFDFAGFVEDQPQLAVIGLVWQDPRVSVLARTFQSSYAGDTQAYRIVVVPNRQSIINYLDQLSARDWISQTFAPTADVAGYYSKQPSIGAINDTLQTHLGNDTPRFVTRKQLLDDIVAPEAVLPDSIEPGSE